MFSYLYAFPGDTKYVISAEQRSEARNFSAFKIPELWNIRVGLSLSLHLPWLYIMNNIDNFADVKNNQNATVVTRGCRRKFTLCTTQCVPSWLTNEIELPVKLEWQFA